MIEIPLTTVIKPIVETLFLWLFLFVGCAIAGPKEISDRAILWVAGVTLLLALLYPLTHFGVLVWN